MSWKIIVGGLLIFGGIAQFLKLINEYRHNTTLPMSIGLGLLFIALVIVGVYLVGQGRRRY